MIENRKFNTGYIKADMKSDCMFVSVTPGFEHGPGIQRDGITAPRMRDPHSVPYVCSSHGLLSQQLPYTTDPYIQRAGTWTLYQHIKHFVEAHGDSWTVVGVQSCGDLTMNPWHVAYLGKSHLKHQQGTLCGLLTEGDPKEPTESRVYRCLVKWSTDLDYPPATPYEWLDIKFSAVQGGYAAELQDADMQEKLDSWLKKQTQYNRATRNIAPLLDFALSGKPIVERGCELSLSNAIDRFQDIRHVFNLPTVDAIGAYQGTTVQSVNFGEYQLYQNMNERRASLSSAVIIDLNIGDFVSVTWENLDIALRKRHFKETTVSPSQRGFYRRYIDDLSRNKVEIFFPHNVYPFGVIGSYENALVSLASGGLSGRVGNTLEGITRTMFDFFGCHDAAILDEGFDTFQIVNPTIDGISYKYDNAHLLAKLLGFTMAALNNDQQESIKSISNYDLNPASKIFRQILHHIGMV